MSVLFVLGNCLLKMFLAKIEVHVQQIINARHITLHTGYVTLGEYRCKRAGCKHFSSIVDRVGEIWHDEKMNFLFFLGLRTGPCRK